MSDTDDEDGSFEAKSKCPICATEFCTQHLLIAFADGWAHAGILADEWEPVIYELRIRLVDAWLEGKDAVDGPRDLTKLLAWFSDLDREETVREATEKADSDDPASWSEEVFDELGFEGLKQNIEQIMLRALEGLDALTKVSHYYENILCVSQGNEIFASNPKAVERRFRMVLGLNNV